jgi:hypothetical protein
MLEYWDDKLLESHYDIEFRSWAQRKLRVPLRSSELANVHAARRTTNGSNKTLISFATHASYRINRFLRTVNTQLKLCDYALSPFSRLRDIAYFRHTWDCPASVPSNEQTQDNRQSKAVAHILPDYEALYSEQGKMSLASYSSSFSSICCTSIT